ncbi:polynucleotide 5'-hydroxyl-kinase NOL9 isoform X2 [Odontomachus brunneus]|nr:polynucleotide 5'-hydroxyl-kinase NOL9 isoform X2 [Odontomachus brunneus]
MPLDDCTALSVPKIFEQRSKAQSEIDTYDRNVFARETWSKENNARIIDSECVNPDNARSLAEHKESALPMPWDANETNETEDNGAISNNELGNVAVNKVGGVNVARRESVESSDRSTNSNNDAVAYKSLQLEDTGELCHENDPNSEAEDSEAISNSGLKEASLQDPKNVRAHKVKQPQLYSIRNIVIVIMEKDSAFGFTGKLSVKVLYGAVEVYGAILNASKDPVEVYSPRGYSNVIINTCGEVPDDTIDQIWTKFNADGITRDSETTLFENIDKVKPGMAVLVLRNIENNLTHFLKTYYPLRLFPDVKNSSYYPWTDYRRAEMVLQAQLQVKYHDLRRRGLFIDSRISDIANGMLTRWRANKWSCALIAGGKDVGKSTSVRFLINKLLHTCEKVVLIDVDPGQSECTPYSCVSYSLIEQPLLGPNFTHLQTPVYQLFIGEIDVMQCATRYLEAIKMLITKLKSCSELSRLPIVVNTMGFTQYVGWYLLISTVKLIRPSVILQILSAKNRNNYRNWLNADTVNKQDRKWTLHNIPLADWYKPCDHELFVMHSNAESKEARVPKKWNMEPYQQRELVMISYLSDITRDSYDPFQCDEDQSLKINEVVPYMAPLSSLCIIPQRSVGVPPSHVLNVINGNIVALCGVDLTEEPSQESDDSYDVRVLTHKTSLCTCYGFGIIRGVDMEQKQIFINTPLPISMMQHVNCLAGCISIPPSLLQVIEGALYVGADATLPTSRKPRKGYFRMRRGKKSKTDNHKSSQNTKLYEDTVKRTDG